VPWLLAAAFVVAKRKPFYNTSRHGQPDSTWLGIIGKQTNGKRRKPQKNNPKSGQTRKNPRTGNGGSR